MLNSILHRRCDFLAFFCALFGTWWLLYAATCAGNEYQTHHYDSYEKSAVFIILFGWAPFGAIFNFISNHHKGILDGVAVISTTAIAIFTARLWASTEKLWGVTDSTLKKTNEINQREGRAYISVRPRGIREYSGRDYLIGHIEIANVGRIPAKDVSIFSIIQHDETNGLRENAALPLGRITKSPTVLQPNATIEFGTYCAGIDADGKNIDGGVDIPIHQRLSNNPLNMKGYLYVWGIVTYTDGLGTNGWTRFCHRYPCRMFGENPDGPRIQTREARRGIDLRYARYHEVAGNEAD
jgi:hypothetical protein